MDSLKNYLQSDYTFSESEIDRICNYFTPKQLLKNEYFLKEGQYCLSIAFVVKGSFIYYNIIDGEEKVCDFAFEDDWITQYKSLLNNIPSELYIKALEASKIFEISLEKMHELTQEIPATNAIRSNLAEKYFTISAERATSLATLQAEERYQKLIEDMPFIHQRVPQYHIASFLGIKPQSLSRIRAKK